MGEPLNDPYTYSIMDKNGNELVPIIDSNNILMSDMLMIIRIPNPWHDLQGYITIIGGLHGYSLRAFFREDHINNNLNMLYEYLRFKDCFQMLIPATINHKEASGELLWENSAWSNWRFDFDILDPKEFSDIPPDMMDKYLSTIKPEKY